VEGVFLTGKEWPGVWARDRLVSKKSKKKMYLFPSSPKSLTGCGNAMSAQWRRVHERESDAEIAETIKLMSFLCYLALS
jgi:hypothetical protein